MLAAPHPANDRPVPDKTIYAQLRITMYSAKVEKVHYNGRCVRSVIKSGTVKAPSAIGWAVWEKQASH